MTLTPLKSKENKDKFVKMVEHESHVASGKSDRKNCRFGLNLAVEMIPAESDSKENWISLKKSAWSSEKAISLSLVSEVYNLPHSKVFFLSITD